MGSITAWLVSSFTRLHQTASLNTNKIIFPSLVSSSLVKLETSRTVMLPPTVSVLCIMLTYLTFVIFRRPGPYNNFLRELRPEIFISSRLLRNFWSELVEKNLGLIARDILMTSDVSREEADQFLKVHLTNQTIFTFFNPTVIKKYFVAYFPYISSSFWICGYQTFLKQKFA